MIPDVLKTEARKKFEKGYEDIKKEKDTIIRAISQVFSHELEAIEAAAEAYLENISKVREAPAS